MRNDDNHTCDYNNMKLDENFIPYACMVGWLIILLMKYVFFNEITTWKFLVHIALYTQTSIFLHPKRKKK